ncbi:MAG: MerC domain-containing protein [Bacteroidota bacterium]
MNFLPINKNTLFTDQSDVFGAMASGLCLVHCIATPFIFVAQACSTTCCAASPFWWSLIDYLFLFISFLAVYHSAKHSSLKWMPTVLYVSWAALALFIVNERFEFFSMSRVFYYLPAIILVGLHLYNRKYCCPSDSDQCAVAE